MPQRLSQRTTNGTNSGVLGRRVETDLYHGKFYILYMMKNWSASFLRFLSTPPLAHWMTGAKSL
jgi:hypothetical protein